MVETPRYVDFSFLIFSYLFTEEPLSTHRRGLHRLLLVRVQFPTSAARVNMQTQATAETTSIKVLSIRDRNKKRLFNQTPAP